MKTALFCVSIAAAIFSATPSFAQADLGGQWAARQHEQARARRWANIGEFQGLPINAADRMRGDSWSRRSGPSQTSVHSASS
jgi:hypothetical protein